MKLENYFSDKSGIGVFSTANDKGEVNAAVYAKPHFIDDGTIAFIMRDRLTRQNLQSNPFAHYLFIEHGEGTHGVRLGLTMQEENQDQERIKALSRRPPTADSDKGERFLVTFRVNKSLRLVGGEEKLF
jgi:hypothetical protein